MPGQFAIWSSVLTLVAAGCIVDDPRCGKGQRVIESGYMVGCVCDTGHVPNADGVGCHACAAHEVAKAGMCACESGFTRANPSAACAPKEELPETDAGGGDAGGGDAGGGGPATRGQDEACASASDCANFDATYCLTLQPPSRCLVQGCSDGTRSCASDRDCCVITVLPELAATGGLCVPKGTCSAPGMVVTP